MPKKEGKIKELIEKYNINLDKLQREQLKLSKNLEIKDNIDFNLADRVAGTDNVFFRNKIISVIVIIQNGEIIEQEYFEDKIRFPYISGYRAYRELPAMVQVFNQLDEKPDVVFIRGHGISHPKRLGLASHFSLTVDVPTIGVAESLLVGEVRNDNILIHEEVVGKVIHTKEGAKPLYISPGNKISVTSSAELVRKFTKEQHKLPEPLRLAKRYGKEVRKEIFKSED